MVRRGIVSSISLLIKSVTVTKLMAMHFTIAPQIGKFGNFPILPNLRRSSLRRMSAQVFVKFHLRV